MTTLKHAFEAGNMKNLVLKIIRGSYPPVPPKYSYEIRNLIAQLFKRNARDRPSINAVLRKPLLQNRIKKFLTDNEYCDEFSHTVMHGQKIQKALPAGQKHAAPVRAVPVAAKKPPSTPRYNPASVYAPSVARRSRDAAPKVRKSSETRKSSDSGAARKSSEVKRPGGGVNSAQSELEKRRKELFQKEKVRQEAARLREQQYARQHKELQEKQKMARMQKAREEGWRSLLDSDESAPSNRKAPSPKRDEPRRISPSPAPSKPSVQAGAPAGRDRGQYEHYHAFLDKLDQERKAAPVIRPTPLEPPGAHGAGAAVGGVAGALGYVAHYGGGEAARAAQHGQAAGARGADAANKAKILEEYLQRKREAALNKARGVSERAGRPSSAQPGGNAGAAAAAAREGRPVSAREAHRKNQEEEYMARLKQIRLNNFNERRMQQAKENAAPQYKPPSGPESKNDQDVRRRKIEALRRPPCPKRAQADERARRLKAELERKRREAYELEQQRLQAMAKAKAAPVIPMTDAMKAIGAAQVTPPVVPSGEKPPIGMTAAMEAIGAGPSATPEDTKSPLQKKKEEILKRLNSKPKVSKWGKPVEPISERPKWCEAGDSGDLSHMKLEETASHMEATSANDGVTRYGEKATAVSESADQAPLSARRQWGGRAGTVLNVLQGADLTDVSDGRGLALSAGSDSSSASLASPPPQLPAPGKASGIGSTITLDKKAPNKGTQVLTRASLPVVPLVPKGPEEAPTPREDPKKEEEAPKKLFDKVEFDEDEDDDNKQEQDDVVIEDLDDEEDEKKSAVVVKAGLRTGVFDVGDIKMLRTCSEPDLSKLFRTAVADNPFFKDEVHASLDLPSMDEDDEEDEEGEDGEDMEDGQVQTEGEGQSEGREGDDEDDGSAGDLEEDDEDDLQTVRESMMSLLEDDDDEDNDSTLTAVSQKKKTKKTTKKTKSKFKKKKGKSFKDVDSSGEGDTSTGSSLLRSESAEDFVTMRETMRGILQSVTERPTKRRAETETKAGAEAGAGDSQASEKDDVEVTSTIVPGSESWQSDDEEEDYFEDDNDDMFSRLEEKRARLEQDLGCDTFLKAYKTVQAIHEDEDENMEEGIRLVSRILGDDKSHLYPAILQLVMADGVFMEDNS